MKAKKKTTVRTTDVRHTKKLLFDSFTIGV
jgi:hypothetical protein